MRRTNLLGGIVALLGLSLAACGTGMATDEETGLSEAELNRCTKKNTTIYPSALRVSPEVVPALGTYTLVGDGFVPNMTVVFVAGNAANTGRVVVPQGLSKLDWQQAKADENGHFEFLMTEEFGFTNTEALGWPADFWIAAASNTSLADCIQASARIWVHVG